MPVINMDRIYFELPSWAHAERYDYCDSFTEEMSGSRKAGWLKKLTSSLGALFQ